MDSHYAVSALVWQRTRIPPVWRETRRRTTRTLRYPVRLSIKRRHPKYKCEERLVLFCQSRAPVCVSARAQKTEHCQPVSLVLRSNTSRNSEILTMVDTSEINCVYESCYPSIIYGTAWKGLETEQLTSQAIASGFRAIDTANQRKHYLECGVGAAIANAIAEETVTRDDIFLQTKFTHAAGQDHRVPYDPNSSYSTQVAQSLDSSLEHLGVDHIDSYLLHAPLDRHVVHDADWEVWTAMEDAVHSNHVRMLGISNASARQIEAIVASSRVKPTFVQNRCVGREGWDAETRAVCRIHGIVYQAFSLIRANREIVSSRFVIALAKSHGKTPSQVLLKLALQLDIVPITGTTNIPHMHEALELFDFDLSEDDIQTILADSY